MKTKARPVAHWKLVIFHKGKRIEKPVVDKRQLVDTFRSLKAKGVRVAVVSRVTPFWPRNDDPGPDNPGKLWCPYCRAWRFFSIPPMRSENGVEPMSEEYWDMLHRRVLNSSTTPWCQWCHISLNDFHVKQMNEMWGWAPGRRRRTRRKPPTTRRRRR